MRTTRITSRVLIVVLGVALLATGLALAQALVAERQARDQVERTTSILSLLRDALRAGVDAETGQRGFLLTGRQAYLEPYRRSVDLWLPTIEELDSELSKSATSSQQRAVDRIRILATSKLEELNETVDLASAGRLQEALAIVRTNEGREIMNEFRRVVAQLEFEEETLLRIALNDARGVEARTIPILIFLGLSIMGLVVFGFWLERRTVMAEAAARDVDIVREARERADLLARELNHRVKNLFAVIISIVGLSGRGETDVKKVVSGIRSRIHALSLAHSVSQGQLDAKIVELRDVLAATLEPYDNQRDRIVLEGPVVELPVKSVTPLGLVAHELATNAAKYGALSLPEGRIEIRWTKRMLAEGEEIELVWQEYGGPSVESGPTDGFGSVMMNQASRQIAGTLDREWLPDGVRATLTFMVNAD
ncbi:CHASE3 domain-containing protein [Rhizobiaceae bacterium]|nr:CHASE3 domain-containing protein [Rhizobiaceae bacterium]